VIKVDEAALKKTILLKMEIDALDNLIFEQTFQRKITDKFKELSKNQPLVIRIIGMEGEVTPSTIGNYTGMDKSSITRMVDDLIKKGMVVRKNDPEDRRKVRISLTDKGLECCNYFDEIIDEILKCIDKKDVRDYIQTLETMVTILKKIAHQHI
jgi:DNA-binding MarR family transcriptional regulator